MREIKIDDVRAGDVARSNGRELRVSEVRATGYMILCDGSIEYGWIPSELTAFGVTFWREERELPDYPGAVVTSRNGHRCAVRACDRGENFSPWLTTAGVAWKHESELLDWLGPDWEEMTTPPARGWVPVDRDQIREGDFARFEWADGDAVEDVVTIHGHEIEFDSFDITVSTDDPGKWFKRGVEA